MAKMTINETRDIPMDQLSIGKSQVRTSGVNKGIKELAKSIKTVGLLEPITVYQVESNKFEVVAGQRRFLACQELKVESIRANILEGNLDEKTAKTISLTENMMREAMSQKDLIDACTYFYRQYGSMKMVSEETGLPYDKVRGYVKFDRLTPELQKMVEDGLNVKTALRAQDAATGEGGEVSNADAMKFAKEMAGMSGVQQEDIVKARQDKPKVSADSVIEEAKSGKRKQIVVTLGPGTGDALEKYAQSEQTNQDDAASSLIEGGLEDKGFLGSGG